MSSSSDFSKLIRSFFGHPPTHDQDALIEHLSEFVTSSDSRRCFVLKGYAGTGKTTLLAALVKSMETLKKKTVLMAPTGRAAKVLSNRSGKAASTIHKRLYFIGAGADGAVRLQLAPNKFKNALFIVDEASMIGDFSVQNDGSVSRNLIEDVFDYIYSGENCKLILLGDEGQLPPVGSDESPALNPKYLEHHFPAVDFTFFGLTEVVRQQADSGIIQNATVIRQAQQEGDFPQLKLTGLKDVREVLGDELIEKIESAYDRFGSEEVMIVTRSNKRANLYNQNIRNRILYMEDELCGGDLLMVVKNNYYWLDPLSAAGFIANGELVRVHRVKRIEELYGIRFARLEISLIDYPDMDRMEVLAFMETLTNEAPNLDRDFMKKLFFEIEKDYLHERNKQKRYKLIMETPYFNALQIKFAYAVTCHKSQGGQWGYVFVDHGFVPPEQQDLSFLRWLYTATTRAVEELAFVNVMEELKG